MDTKVKSSSWSVIIIVFLVFWPVGIYLLIKKLSSDKAASMRNSKIFMVLGGFFVFASIVMIGELLGGSTDVSTGVFGFFFYLIGGVFLIMASFKLKKEGEQYRRLIDIVINQEQHTIENISSQMGFSYDQTVEALQKMIDKGYFAGAFIDYGNHEIVLQRKASNLQQTMDIGQPAAYKQKAIKCLNCGGNNVINVGQVCECEYCGSPIQEV